MRFTLEGVNLPNRLLCCAGALIGIAATGLLCRGILLHLSVAPALIAPMGASAVLLYAVPASPLAQPWPVIGGNTLSALVGILVARLIPDPMVAGAVAVGGAIAVMSLTRSLHPPGGASALTATIGGPAVLHAGFGFALYPVAVNSLLMVIAAWAFHRFSGHSYPHRPAIAAAGTHATADPPATARVVMTPADVAAAVRELGEAVDVSAEDLGALFLQAERHALERLHGGLSCGEVMARDVVSVSVDSPPQEAREKLIRHAFRVLPVVDRHNRVVGLVGHAQLGSGEERMGDVMIPAAVERPETPALALLGRLCDGRGHEVVIVDAEGRLAGIVTQTDLLAVLGRAALDPAAGAASPKPREAA